MPLIALTLACVLLAPLDAWADAQDDWQTWGAVLATGTLGREGSPYRYWLEGQGRFNDDTSRLGQGLLRAALGHALAPRTAVWAGYGYFTTDPQGVARNVVEHRIWQQLTWSAAAPRAGFALSSRTRLEQRLIDRADDTGWRFRQLFKLTRPVAGSERFYVSLWDEVFVAFNDTDWGAASGFDQNRAFAGLGVQLAPALRTEVGYMNQYVARERRADASNHVLSLTLFLDF